MFPVNWTAARSGARLYFSVFYPIQPCLACKLKHLAENTCDRTYPWILYSHVLEILLKSEEVRQPRSNYHGWKEGGRWNSRSSQRPRTSGAGIVLEHTIPVFRIGSSFFRPGSAFKHCLIPIITNYFNLLATLGSDQSSGWVARVQFSNFYQQLRSIHFCFRWSFKFVLWMSSSGYLRRNNW